MSKKIDDAINRLAADLCITYEQAEEIFNQSIIENQQQFGNYVDESVYAECPFTGTLEKMK